MSCHTEITPQMLRTLYENKPTPRYISVIFWNTGDKEKLLYASNFQGKMFTYTELRIRITWTSLWTAALEIRWCSCTFKILKENYFQLRIPFLVKPTITPKDHRNIFHGIKKLVFNVLFLMKQLKGMLHKNEKRKVCNICVQWVVSPH